MKQSKLHQEQSTESNISVIQEKKEKPPLAPKAVKTAVGVGFALGMERGQRACSRGVENREKRESDGRLWAIPVAQEPAHSTAGSATEGSAVSSKSPKAFAVTS